MKDPPLSTLERTFLLRCLCGDSLRLDGRGPGDRRDLDLTLGSEPGSCLAALGETRVLAQASCALAEPQVSRPNEGQLRIEVEFSPMAAPRFAEARQQDSQDERVELLRLLEVWHFVQYISSNTIFLIVFSALLPRVRVP